MIEFQNCTMVDPVMKNTAQVNFTDTVVDALSMYDSTTAWMVRSSVDRAFSGQIAVMNHAHLIMDAAAHSNIPTSSVSVTGSGVLTLLP